MIWNVTSVQWGWTLITTHPGGRKLIGSDNDVQSRPKNHASPRPSAWSPDHHKVPPWGRGLHTGPRGRIWGGAGVARDRLGPRPGVVLTLPGQGENPFILALGKTTQIELELIIFKGISIISSGKSQQGHRGAAKLTRRGPQVCRCPPCLNRSARPESILPPSKRQSRRSQRLTRTARPPNLSVSIQPSFTHHQLTT